MTEVEQRKGERRHPQISDLLSLILLVLQFGALVWGASAIKSSVDQLKEAVAELKIQSKSNYDKIVETRTEVEILRSRLPAR